MNKILVIHLICFAFILSSCEKLLLEPKPEQNNMALFNEYAKIVQDKYAMFDFKNVDILKLKDSLAQQITENLTPLELLTKMAFITSRLRDGHSPLIASIEGENYGYNFDPYQGYPLAFDTKILNDHYINPSNLKQIVDEESGAKVLYGRLAQDFDIAYMRIASFSINIEDEDFEQIFKIVSGSKGLIIDVRENGGGDPVMATKLASYFTKTEVYTGYERFKTGPGPNDFTDSQSNLKPADSEFIYSNPVAVLTNRGVYSATTTLCYNLDAAVKDVTFIGQRTGGGSGSVADGYLSNGWYWGLSVSEFIDAKGNRLDDGVDPDIEVNFLPEVTDKDEILEAAIVELQ